MLCYANWDGSPSLQMIKFFEEKAKGGCAMVTMGDTPVDEVNGVGIPRHIKLIDQNVNLLADKLNISAAYFGKLFTEFTGSRTLDYILKVRMEKARDLLLSEADKDISQIADAVGYNNSTYFTTAFKKFYGVTPSRFRDYHAVSELEGGSASRE